MSDEHEFVYRNENTGDIVRYPYRSPRLDMLPNWVTLQDPEAQSEEAPDADTPPAEQPRTPGTQEPPPAVVTEPPGPQAPGDEPPAEPDGGGDGSGPDAPERPARSASKADWQAYARERAQDSDEEAAIDGLTKDELIKQYGGDS
ncbi:hypothetical protein ACGFNQ_02380 [Streptomyces asoensis]|uniref:hypothetical protein n=1 Tax=Streptomyces asoensis TaxID=249586 RepID=UPI003722EB37